MKKNRQRYHLGRGQELKMKIVNFMLLQLGGKRINNYICEKMKGLNFEEINVLRLGLIVGFVLSFPNILFIQEMDLSDKPVLISTLFTRFFLTIFSTIIYTLVFGFFGMITLSLFVYGVNLWIVERNYLASIFILFAALCMLYPTLGLTYFPDLMNASRGNYDDDSVVYPYYPVN